MTATELKAYASRVLGGNSVKSTAGALAVAAIEFLSDLEKLGMEMDEDVSLDDSDDQTSVDYDTRKQLSNLVTKEDVAKHFGSARKPVTGDVGGLTSAQAYVFQYVHDRSMAKAGSQVDGNVAKQLIVKGLLERLPRGVGHRGGRGGVWYQLTEKGRALAEQVFARTLDTDRAEDR